VIPAREAGMVTVWVNRGAESASSPTPVTPDYTVSDLSSVPDLLLGLA